MNPQQQAERALIRINADIEQLESHRQALIQALETAHRTNHEGPVELENDARGRMGSLALARMVLLKLNGEGKTTEEIQHLSRTLYGIELARSFANALSQWVELGRIFYRDGDGRVLLLELHRGA